MSTTTRFMGRNRRENTMDNSNIQERSEPQMQPRAGMTVADVEAFHAERKAEAQRINLANCVTAGWYVQILDPYGVLDVPGEWDCIGHNWFVRNLPDGDWVWSGDLPEGTRKALEGREEKEAPWLF